MSDLLDYETYKPTPKQLQAHISPKRFKMYGGSMGSGKSVWLCAETIRLALLFPGNAGLIARYRYKDFKRTTLPILMELLPQKIIKSYNKSDGMIVLTNGSNITTSDLEDPNKLKSQNLGYFGIDEATDVPTEAAFNMLKTRLRRKVKGIRYFGLLATNPEPGWVKDHFITKKSDEYLYVFASPYDNPHLPSGYVDDLIRDLPPIWRAKYIEGSWDAFDAQIFNPEWMNKSSPLPAEFAFTVIAIDPAITEKDYSDKKSDPDETAIVVMGVEAGTNLIHEIDTIHGCWGFNEIIAKIKAAINRYSPDIVGCEKGALKNALSDALRLEGVNLTPLSHDGDKVRRAITVQQFFERGQVRINNQALYQQMVEFPRGTHDDMVDAAVYAVRMIRDNSELSFQRKDEKYAGLDQNSVNFWKGHFDELSETNNTQAFEGLI